MNFSAIKYAVVCAILFVTPVLSDTVSVLPDNDTVPVSYRQQYCVVPKNIGADMYLDAAEIAAILAKNPMHQVDTFDPWEDRYHVVVNDSLYNAATDYWAFPNEKRRDRLKGIMQVIFENRFMTTTTGPQDQLPYTNVLLNIMMSYDALRSNGDLNKAELDQYRKEIKRRYFEHNLYNSKRFQMKKITARMEPFENRKFLDNHTAGKQHLRTLYGYLFNKPSEFAMGEKYYRMLLDDTDSTDHALVAEASRGAFSWKYYPHTLGHLLAIAKLYQLSGKDLTSYRSPISGSTIHDVVKFYVDSVYDPTNPNLMWKYAIRDRNTGNKFQPGQKTPFNYKNLDVLNKKILSINNNTSWYYIYRDMFPGHENARRFAKISVVDSGPANHTAAQYGYDMQCMYPAR
jgi:hypothetical protein